MMQKHGGVRLSKWLHEERRTQEWLAEQIGTHQTNVSAWIRGRPIPLKMAFRIQKVTHRRIKAEEWDQDVESSPDLSSVDADESAA